MLSCPICQSQIPDTEEKCLTCGYNAGSPNVRAAESEQESRALEARYQAALNDAQKRGCRSVVERFSNAVLTSSAVINVDIRFLHFFVTNSTSLYANYEHGVGGKVRKPALFQNDAVRRSVGSALFGAYASEIIYAALSLDGHGPHSYGSYTLTLKEVAIRQRATVLEQNSYAFVKKHNLIDGIERPQASLAPWATRNKLAVAKMAPYITSQTTDADFAGLLISSSGDRKTDEFIEVHIYGTFDLAAIESIIGSSKGGSRDERSLLRMIKPHLKKAGITWVEHD